MGSRGNRSRILAALALVAVAILGYAVGHGRSAAPSPAPEAGTRTILTSSLLLTYPSGWAQVARGPAIPGLSIAGPVAVAPAGDGSRAGLLTGQLRGGEPSPLPAGFLAHLEGLPRTEVVSLTEVQAYRYSKLNVVGFNRALTLYVIPNPGANPTVLACYASGSAAGDISSCEQIVASLRLQLAPSNYSLTPEPAYAHEVSAALAAVDASRAVLRRALRTPGARPVAQSLAARLAHTLASAAASLSALQPPPPASQTQVLLSQALARAGGAYGALASAAASASRSRYLAARAQVYEAEAGVGTVLRTFSLLGYGQT